MSYFKKLQDAGRINDRETSVWKFGLTELDFEELKQEIISSNYIKPMDAFLYYAEWWKYGYSGGIPSKRMILDSIGGDVKERYTEERFYDYAIKGAIRFGVKWIKKQNTLIFRTLLLQGGLPLRHISLNINSYQNFLLAVLEEQPESMEDFMFNSEITNILPPSSQNDLIYENCFEIVRSILNESKENPYEKLFNNNQDLNSIFRKLRGERERVLLIKKTREAKPKIYWILSKNQDDYQIELNIGLANFYSRDELEKLLNIPINESEYKLYLNDELFCTFERVFSGNYKLDYENDKRFRWDRSDSLPEVYTFNNGERVQLNDFIYTSPILESPTLWIKFSDNEWKLVKGTSTSHKNAVVIHSDSWQSDKAGVQIKVQNQNNIFTEFEGEISFQCESTKVKYKCGVSSFDWIISTDRPKWMIKSNMPVVRDKPRVILYDENGKVISSKEYRCSYQKRGASSTYLDSSVTNLKPGCYDLKIEYNGLTAFDSFYNIGEFTIKDTEKSIDEGKIEISGLEPHFQFTINPKALCSIARIRNIITITRSTGNIRIPTHVPASLKESTYKSLTFEMETPLKGIAIIDPQGNIISRFGRLILDNINGYRIITNQEKGTNITFQNLIRTDVIIEKRLNSSITPLSYFRDDMRNLFFLSDSMNLGNKVRIILENGSSQQINEISLFSSEINTDQATNSIVNIDSDNQTPDNLKLLAIPLNVKTNDLDVIHLDKNNDGFILPKLDSTSDFIVISDGDLQSDVMPRYVNTAQNTMQIPKRVQRMDMYHSELFNNSFEHDSWKQLIKYFKICKNYEIPFSTLDQLRSIVGSSMVAAKAFLILGHESEDKEEYIQRIVPKIEIDLGFRFHWVSREDWGKALNITLEYISTRDKFKTLVNKNIFKSPSDELNYLIINHFSNINLIELFGYINNQRIQQSKQITNAELNDIKSLLGNKVLNQLPINIPWTIQDYEIPINNHNTIILLLRSPIAAAETIAGLNRVKSLWSCEKFTGVIRRNIQCAEMLNPDFYKRVLIYTLGKL